MYKVMLVDDEPWILKDLQVLIDWNREGFEISGSAGSGEEAELLMRKCVPDIIISDIRMPGMSGLDLLERIKKKYKDVLVVFLSAYSEFVYAQQAVKLGAFDYILKPVEISKLQDVLQRASAHIFDIKSIRVSIEDIASSKVIFELLDTKADYKRISHEMVRHGFINDDWKSCIIGVAKILRENNEINSNYSFESLISEFTGLKHLLVHIGSRKMVCLIGAGKDLLEENSIVKLYRRIYKSAMDNNASIGISKLFTGMEGAREAYAQADVMADCDFITGCAGVHFYKQKCLEGTNQFVNQVVNVQSKDRLRELIGMLPALVKKKSLNPAALSRIYNTVLYSVSRLDGTQKSAVDILNDKDIIYSFNDVNQFTEYLVNSVSGVCTHAYKTNSGVIISEMLKNIRESYGQKLMIGTFAEKFHINSSYLSSVFKAETGKSFTDCLLEVRLNKAVELLKNSSLQLIEISEKVGYDDYYHFSKLFKKYKGISPNIYRKTN